MRNYLLLTIIVVVQARHEKDAEAVHPQRAARSLQPLLHTDTFRSALSRGVIIMHSFQSICSKSAHRGEKRKGTYYVPPFN